MIVIFINFLYIFFRFEEKESIKRSGMFFFINIGILRNLFKGGGRFLYDDLYF